MTSVLVLLALSTTTGAADAPRGGSPGIWMATRVNVEALEGLDRNLTAQFFDDPDALVLEGWGGATTAMGWASVAAFERDLAAGVIPDSVRLVMYDPEAWAHTPLREQQDPATWMRRFASLAHSAGYLVMMTPHPGLVTVPGAVCANGEDEDVVAAFLRCRIAEVAGATADVVDLQLQTLETKPAAYRRAFVVAAGQVRDANHDVEVLAHLTTAIARDANVLFSAWRAVGDVADGFYLGIPGRTRPKVALGFLHMVSATSPPAEGTSWAAPAPTASPEATRGS